MGLNSICKAITRGLETVVSLPAIAFNKALGEKHGNRARIAVVTGLVGTAAILGTGAAFATAMLIVPGFSAAVAPATKLASSLLARVGVAVTAPLLAKVAGPAAFAFASAALWFAVPQFRRPSAATSPSGLAPDTI